MGEKVESIEFDESQRIAIQHEVFEDDEGSGEWVQRTDFMDATRIEYGADQIVFRNDETDALVLISADNFLTSWSDGAF